MITVLSSASARPNFVKLAAVHHALAKHADNVRHVIVHTGQHYDPLLSDIFFTQLKIPDPAFNLGVKGAANRNDILDATMKAFEEPLKQVKPDIVLVYGDVNGALGATRAAKKLRIRVGHVEAGLRSFDLKMPEEVNRIEIDGVADDLFVTEQSAIDHLANEGVKGRVHFVGNTMIDTLIRMKPLIDAAGLPKGVSGRFGVATIHRPSNVDSKESIEKVLTFLSEIAGACPLVFPLHRRTQRAMQSFGISAPKNLIIIEPLGYIEFLHLASQAEFILTDSGGIQEEATLLRKRCFTLRRNTERPSTIDSGSNVLIDPDNASDRKRVLDFAAKPTNVSVKIPKFWDGKAGDRIADAILSA